MNGNINTENYLGRISKIFTGRESPYRLAGFVLPFLIMQEPSSGNIRTTTIRLTKADQIVIDRLRELTGNASLSSLIRSGLRTLLRRIERQFKE